MRTRARAEAGTSKVFMLPNSEILERSCTPERGIDREVLESVLALAVDIAREGREGRKIGTLFVVGDVPAVMEHSKELILDPLHGHPPAKKCITSHDLRETVKELAQLDGAFVVSGDGVVLSACRYLDTSSRDIKLPLGLGSRHMAAASITKQTDAMAVVVSESSVVRVFDDGKIVAEIIPEFWIMSQYESVRERYAAD
jgi:DNA integrity scanning protein DisA with diadenylate cyclase activity